MKKLLSCVLAGSLILQGTQKITNAANQGLIQVGSTSVGAGENFELPIVIEENPGITALNLSLTYDEDKLELLEAKDCKILGSSTFLTTDSVTKVPYILSWDDVSTENNTGVGTVAILSFRAKENAIGNANVSVEINQRSTYNVDLEEIAFDTLSGIVSILGDENSPTIIADTVSGSQGDTVEMPIRIQNNPGIAALNLSISYDNSMLKLLGAEDGKILGTSTFLTTDNLEKIPYILSWDDLSTKNNTGNGIVATLKFEILADKGNPVVEIALIQKSTYNVELKEIQFVIAYGKVNIDSQITTMNTSTTKETTTITTSTSNDATTTGVSTSSANITDTSCSTSIPITDSTFTNETKNSFSNGAGIIADTIFGNQGDTVEMPIRLQNNPGIAALNISILYDNTKLKLLGAEDGKILGTSTFLTTDNLEKIPYILSWDDLSTENNTENGIVATLKFEVLVAEGEAVVEITLNQKSTYNVDLEEIAFSTMNGTVQVGTALNHLNGDMNNDGSINLKDVVILRRYIAGGWNTKIDAKTADINGDGSINLKDVVILRRYIAGGWNVTLK